MAIQTQMNLGRVRPVYKGAYNALAAYGTLDMVLYEKEIWMMVARSYTPGDLPVDAGNGLSASGAWAKIGYQGERGLQGETGPIGPYYRPSVAVDGTFSWTNDGGLVNPDPVKIDLYWHQISGTCTQVSTTQFTVAGTESAIVEGRGVRINDAILTHIKSVSVANDVTTVTVDTAVVPATISKVEVGVINIDMLPTITGFLPLSGGVGIPMTGNLWANTGGDFIISTINNDAILAVRSASSISQGAYLYLYGGAQANNPGKFMLCASGNGATKTLRGDTGGTLTWDGNSVVTVETGTWTPTVYGSTTKGAATITSNTSYYQKFGNLIFLRVNFRFTITSSPAGKVRIGGLPYAADFFYQGPGGTNANPCQFFNLTHNGYISPQVYTSSGTDTTTSWGATTTSTAWANGVGENDIVLGYIWYRTTE